MPDFVPIYQGRDFYVPDFDVKIRGVDLPAQVRGDVMQVKYQDHLRQIDSFDLTINNWDAEQQDFKYTGSTKAEEDEELTERSRIFDPGQEIELLMGYHSPLTEAQQEGREPGPLSLMLVGEITSLTPNFPASGKPTLKVSGQNILRKFMTRQETHYYEDRKDSQIAERVGRRGNLRIRDVAVSVRIDPDALNQEPVEEHVLQDNQYDILFLLQRAHYNGYDVLLKYENQAERTEPFLFFGPSPLREQRRAYILEWGKSLIQFQPKLTTTRQVAQLTVRGWDALSRRRIEVTVRRRDLRTRGLRSRRQQQRIEQAFNEREEIIVDRPFRNRQEARKYARGRLERISQDFITGRGSTLGTPDLRTGSIVQIQGLGLTFSGRYFITSTTHTINASGYITQFEARKEEENDESD